MTKATDAARRGEFRVTVTKDDLVFSSAHFITLPGHRCEGLHGHNYRTRVTIEGAIDEEAWFVFDFIELKRIMQRLCHEIDHKVLLPTMNPRLQVAAEGDVVTVAYEGTRRYLFPAADCVLLPIPNTTVEMLASLLADRLCAAFEPGAARGVAAVEMEVEESFGQSAVCRVNL